MVRDGDSRAAPAVYPLTARVATHGSPLGPLAFDARFAPPNRGGDAVRDCPCGTVVLLFHPVSERGCAAGVVYTLTADVDNSTSLGGRPAVLKRA